MKRIPNLLTLLTLLLVVFIFALVAYNAYTAKALSAEAELEGVGPQPPVLIGPEGKIDTNRPTLTWRVSPGASAYWVLLFDGKRNIIARWYSAAEAGCNASTCSLIVPKALSDGQYAWWVKARDAQGIGNWGASKTFTYGNVVKPNAPILISPSGVVSSSPVTFTWTADSNINQFWFLLFDGRHNVVAQWFTRAQAGCNGNQCVFTPNVTLTGGKYIWWVQARQNGLMSNFSSGKVFTTTASTLPNAIPTSVQPTLSQVPEIISPSGEINTPSPLLRWKQAAHASAYWVLVYDGHANLIARWYNLNELSCDASTCSLQAGPFTAGTMYSWWVKPRFGMNEGQWSGGAAFKLTPAQLPTPVVPTAVPTQAPVVPTIVPVKPTARPALPTATPVQPTAIPPKPTIAPTAQPTRIPTSLPEPGAAVPPPYTTSYYMKTINSGTTATVGCEIGKQSVTNPGPESLLVTLDYGRPYDYGDGQLGASLFGFGPATVSQIGNAIKIAGRAYVQCSPGETASHLTIGIGTSNYGKQVTQAHGKAWAEMVNDVNAWFVSQGLYARVDAVGMNDMELGWNSPTVTRDWVKGYDSVNKFPLYNFGDAAGCATNHFPYWGCNDPWTREDVWWISYGSGASYAVPLIYADTGVNAEQWARLSLYGYQTHGLPIEFKGVMTQYQSCVQIGGCGTLDNKPHEGWNYLYKELKRNQATAQYPQYLTDIMWHWADK